MNKCPTCGGGWEKKGNWNECFICANINFERLVKFCPDVPKLMVDITNRILKEHYKQKGIKTKVTDIWQNIK